MKVVQVSLISVALLCCAPPSTAADLVYNRVKAEQFAAGVLDDASKRIVDEEQEIIQLPDFTVTVPKTTILTRDANANLSGSLSGLAQITVDECEYIPAFSASFNVTVRCNLAVRNVEVLLKASIAGDELFGKVKLIALRTDVAGEGPITVDWQGRNGLHASVSGLTTPPLRLTSALIGGSLGLNEDRWESFIKAVHSTLGRHIHRVFMKTYRQILEESTRPRILPYFHL